MRLFSRGTMLRNSRFLLSGLLLFAPGAAWAADARAVHERLLTLDTHLDTPANFARPGWDMTDRHGWDEDFTQVDVPRMKQGGLDGGFFAIYTPQGPRTAAGNAAARDAALLRAVQIREMVARHSDQLELAFRADDAARIAASGKRVIFQSIENAYPIGWDVSLLKTFYDLGVRMAGPVHFTNNDLGDSATDPKGAEWHGLSPVGKAFVAEANRLGMILDASHSSDDVFDQMLAQSTTPIILSHSGCRAVFDHPRNIDDERLKRLAASGGVIQINAYSDYLMKAPANPERDAAFRALGQKYGPLRTLAGAQLKAYAAERRAIEMRSPLQRASLDDVMAHALHALKLVGPDHVGIGLDWDGGGGVNGMPDVAAIPVITERLLAAGYSEGDLQKIWSGNVLRLLRAAEAAAKR
jgi:membrane dipeptidase